MVWKTAQFDFWNLSSALVTFTNTTAGLAGNMQTLLHLGTTSYTAKRYIAVFYKNPRRHHNLISLKQVHITQTKLSFMELTRRIFLSVHHLMGTGNGVS